MQAPLILACDTTQAACSVALYRNGLMAQKLSLMTKGHAEALIPMMEALLAEADAPITAIDRLAVTHGPGTFTGTRVGLSAMRGLALALKKPLKAYGGLHVMALGAAKGLPVLVAVDARRSVFYVQSFDAAHHPLSEPQALSAEMALALMADNEFALMGSGAGQLAELAAEKGLNCHAAEAPDWPEARHVAGLAAADGEWTDPPLPSPFYLRPPDATLPNRDKFPARVGHGADDG